MRRKRARPPELGASRRGRDSDSAPHPAALGAPCGERLSLRGGHASLTSGGSCELLYLVQKYVYVRVCWGFQHFCKSSFNAPVEEEFLSIFLYNCLR